MKLTPMLMTMVAGTLLLLGQATVERGALTINADDEAAIRVIMSHWQESWDKFSPTFLEGDYASDADWINAFGVKNKGAAKIMSFMDKTLKNPSVRERHTTWAEPHIRMVRQDVVMAYRDYQTLGQKTTDGKEMPPRNTHSSWLMAKDKGKWQIVSQVISDDK